MVHQLALYVRVVSHKFCQVVVLVQITLAVDQIGIGPELGGNPWVVL
jgi:hypothetical protein